MPEKVKKEETTLKQDYEKLADRYANAFSIRYLDGADYYWVGGDFGGIIEICDYFVEYDTIRYSIDNDLPEEDLFSWINYGITVGMIDERIKVPTLDEWAHGDRGIPKEQLESLEKASREVTLAEMRLRDLIDETLSKNGIEKPVLF